MNTLKARGKKALVGIIGGLVCLIGFILIPYPGPGWLIVFSGLAILSTEFEFAARVLAYTKGKYEAWTLWLKRQNTFIKTIVVGCTGLLVLVTLWLLNIFGGIVLFFNLPSPYTLLISPFFK